MAFIPVPESWAVTIRFTATGLRPKTMNFHVLDNNFNGSSVSANLLAAAVETWVAAEYAPTYGPGLIVSNIQVRDASQQNGVVVDFGVNEPGTNAGTGLPGNVAFAVSLRTGFAGKSYRGRMYHPWLSEQDVTGNSFAQAAADTIITAWETLNTTLGASDWQIAVASKYTNGAPRPAGVATPVSAFIYTDLNVYTQRRRVLPL